tara:strand:+ start:463 stop:1149 length:687 start_codon:yes stop_codon:yes gene_type:complete
MKHLCIICARKGSKGLINKNFKKLNGIPLVEYTIHQALKSKLFNNIFISTDSNKIKNISKKFKTIFVSKRPNYLSKDNTAKIPVIIHSLKSAEKIYKMKFDVIVDLDVTAPLRKIIDIRNALNKFKKNNSDVLFSVNESKKNPYFNMVEKRRNRIKLSKALSKKILYRQAAPKVYDINASIYIWKREALLKRKTLYTKKTSIYLMPPERSFDIDTKFDWKLVKFLLKK